MKRANFSKPQSVSENSDLGLDQCYLPTVGKTLVALGDRVLIEFSFEQEPFAEGSGCLKIIRLFKDRQERDSGVVSNLPQVFEKRLLHAFRSGGGASKVLQIVEDMASDSGPAELDFEYKPRSDIKSCCWGDGQGLITYTVATNPNFQEFVRGIFESEVHLKQIRRGLVFEEGEAKLDVTIENHPGKLPKTLVQVLPAGGVGGWKGELLLGNEGATAQVVNDLIEDFGRYGPEWACLSLEQHRFNSSGTKILSFRNRAQPELSLTYSQTEWHLEISTNKGVHISLSFPSRDFDSTQLDWFRGRMEGLKGAELWGEHRDAAQRECLTDLRRNAKSCFAFLPPGQCPVLSRLLNNLPPTLKPVLDRREKGTTPSDEQILRAIQGISTVKFEIPTRHFSEISALEVGVGYGLDGFFKISNRIGTKGTFYFSSLDFNSPEDFEDWLKESLYVFAYDPADLVEALDEKSCDRRSKFPKLESESAVKAYRRVGDLAKIILDCSLPLDTVVQPLCVDRKENGFRMSLITRPELELDILVTSAGIQGLEVRFPRLRSWEVQRGASNKLNFSIDPSSDFSETELLGLIAEIGKVRTPAGFRKTSVRSYLRKHSYLG